MSQCQTHHFRENHEKIQSFFQKVIFFLIFFTYLFDRRREFQLRRSFTSLQLHARRQQSNVNEIE